LRQLDTTYLSLWLISGQATPRSRCYVHDAQENTLVLESSAPVKKLPAQLHGPNNVVLLDTVYHDLMEMEFVSTHKETGKKVNFALMLGTQGALRGVPVQIRYQPNWWFQVALNLRPENAGTPHATLASR
jgi:hypothetical protein